MDFSILLNIINFKVLENEFWRLALFVILIIGSFPLANVINYMINNPLKRWSDKTNIKFDDILINSINPSITMFILAGMFYLGSNLLILNSFQILFDKILNFLLIIPLVYFLIKFSTEAIGYYLKGNSSRKVNSAAIDLLIQIVRIILFSIGLILILGNLGYDITALIAGLGVGGIAFALAAQDLLKNFFAGISLIFDKTFNKNERIAFEGYHGVIENLSLRSTKMRTYDGSIITIPNSKLSDNIVENITEAPKVKVNMTIGLVYNTSTEKLKLAKKLILEAIQGEKFADKNSITIWFDNFGAYSLDIKIGYYGKLKHDDWPEKVYFKDRINFTIKESFEKAGIEMAFPTQTIEIQK